MWLTTHGVPFGIAFRVDEQTFRMNRTIRTALAIVCCEFEGRKFRWDLFQFEDQR